MGVKQERRDDTEGREIYIPWQEAKEPWEKIVRGRNRVGNLRWPRPTSTDGGLETGDWGLGTEDWGPPRDQRPGCGREGRRSLATSVCDYRTDAGLPRNPMLRRGSPRRPSQLPGARAETALRRGRAQDGHVRGGECSSVVRLTGGLRVCWTRGDGRGGQASAKGEPCRETRLNLLLGVASAWPHPPLCLRAGPTGLSRLAARLLS